MPTKTKKKRPPELTRQGVYITAETWKRLAIVAAVRGVSRQQVCREALERAAASPHAYIPGDGTSRIVPAEPDERIES